MSSHLKNHLVGILRPGLTFNGIRSKSGATYTNTGTGIRRTDAGRPNRKLHGKDRIRARRGIFK